MENKGIISIVGELSGAVLLSVDAQAAVTREKNRCKAIILCEKLLGELKKETGKWVVS